MRKKQVITLKIEDMEFPSKGIGYFEDTKIFIKNGLIGQTIEARVTKNRKEYSEARLLNVIEKAECEVESFCPHFGSCGGCARQTMPYDEQAKLKGKLIKDMFDENNISYETFEPVLTSPEIYAYRNKMEYSFGDEEKGGETTLGMHRKGKFMDVVTTDQCKIVHEDFNVILRTVLEYFKSRGIGHYQKKQHEGLLRHLIVRKGRHTGEILIGLNTSSQSTFDTAEFVDVLNNLELGGKIVGILHLIDDTVADMVSPDKIVTLYGQDYYMDQIGDLKFKVSFFSFFQTNTFGAEKLYEKTISYIDNIEGKDVFDLFSGTGTIAQIMGEKAKHVTAIELIPDAVEAAKENAKLNAIENCDFIAGDVFVELQKVKKKPEVIIVDPPRVGIHDKAVREIIKFGAKDLVYVSCNPKSLVTNLIDFQNAGYKVEKVCPVDMFPHTPHVEVVSQLVLREGKRRV